MTSRLYVQKRGPSGGTDIEFTAFTGRQGTPFFDDNDSTIEIGHRAFDGEASQGEFRVMDPEAELGRTDFTFNVPSHALVTWTEDDPGSEIWLARSRIASHDGGRGIVKVDNEIEYDVLVDDCNVELRGQAFTESWVRPEETDVARLLALQAYTLNGSSSTADNHRDTCEVTVSTSHLCPNTATVTMPPKKYLPGTQPQDVVRDCAEVAGKLYAVVIHHTGGSHLCLLFVDEGNHTTYASAAAISDHFDEWDPEHPTAPIWEPHWETGRGSHHDGQVLLSGIVNSYAPESAVYVENSDNIQDYDYWVDHYSDGLSTTSAEATTRASGLLGKRRFNHVQYSVSVIVESDQVHLIAAGMSINIKAAGAIGGQYLDTWQTRRIAELRWEPRLDGRYWAHMSLDRPQLARIPPAGSRGPQPPVQSEPGSGATVDHYWSFTNDRYDDGTSTYPGASPSSSVWHPGYVHSHVTMPGVGNVSESPHAPVSAATYHFRAGFGRNSGTPYNPGGIYMDVYAFPSASIVWTSPTITSYGEIVSDDITFPGGTTSFGFEIPFNESFIDFVELSSGAATAAFEGTAPPPAATDSTGTTGTSSTYSPIDHQHAVQTAANTPISNAGEYFEGANVDEALEELAGSILGGSLDDHSDVDLTSPVEGDILYFDGGSWVNFAGHWEAVTNGEDIFVWEGDDLVHEWSL